MHLRSDFLTSFLSPFFVRETKSEKKDFHSSFSKSSQLIDHSKVFFSAFDSIGERKEISRPT
jgi:hypothetical protein